MKDNDITDVLDLTFTVNEEVFGQVRVPPWKCGEGPAKEHKQKPILYVQY